MERIEVEQKMSVLGCDEAAFENGVKSSGFFWGYGFPSTAAGRVAVKGHHTGLE